MDSSVSQCLFQDAKAAQFEFDLASSSTDAGYYSACSSSLSPASSIDSCGFSPPAFQWRAAPEQELVAGALTYGRPAAQRDGPSLPAQTSRRSRSKFPGKKRQTASEREKLRMRDLTKALHHVRSYLPPSVAPAGQTLTKIETLRRTISYISYLSAQLGLSDEALARRAVDRSEADPQQGAPCNIPVLDAWFPEPAGSSVQSCLFAGLPSDMQTMYQESADAYSAESSGQAQPIDQFSAVQYQFQDLPCAETPEFLAAMQHQCLSGYY